MRRCVQSSSSMFLVIVIMMFLAPVVSAQGVEETNFASSADLNDSGRVDHDDMLLFMQQWQTEGNVPPPVPPAQQLSSEILDVTIPEDNKPVVTYSLLNGENQAFDLETTALTTRWIIARITSDGMVDDGRTRYESYINRTVTSASGVQAIQPTYDSGGVLTVLGNGQFSYKFKTAITVLDPSETHVVGGQIENGDQGIYANPLYSFRPDGQPVTVTRLLSSTETCNSCHNVLAFHGGGRREFGLCELCHNPGVNDPESGNTVDMANMIHKIHMGASLPSVESGTPYQIIGHGNSVNDYSHVEFPQDHRNCTTCHNTGAQADFHKQFPSIRACGACHDDIDFAAHFGGQTDGSCKNCHGSTMNDEFDISVPGAHTVPIKSTQLAGLNAEIIEVQNAAPGNTPTVRYKLYDNDNNPILPSALDTVQMTFAGPTIDYATNVTSTIYRSGTSNFTDEGNGVFASTFTTPLPADAEGTFAFALEARKASVTLATGKLHSAVRESAFNPVFYASVDGSLVEERREVIDLAKCNRCHDMLTLHGGLRKNSEYCVMCHNPNLTDEATRTQQDGQMPPESVDMRYMIHKIHKGEELENGYVVHGRTSAVDFGEVRYPGILNDCETCHLPNTNGVPAPEGALPVVVKQAGALISSTGPTTASCLACHDSDEAASHALSNMASPGGVESCSVCHGQFRSEAVDVVHSKEGGE